MASKSDKEQPPAYTSLEDEASKTVDSAESSTSPPRKPGHSTRATQLSLETSEGKITMSQFLELTFSVMVCYKKGEYGAVGTRKPIVLAIDEDYDTLLRDLQGIFPKSGLTSMKASWEDCRGGADAPRPLAYLHDSQVDEENITAMLRLLKPMNGMGYICVD